MIDNEELVDETSLATSKFLLSPEDNDHSVDPETQARLEALLQAAGMFGDFWLRGKKLGVGLLQIISITYY